MRAENATAKSLVFDCEWDIDDCYGCCKIEQVVRLQADYVSAAEVRRLHAVTKPLCAAAEELRGTSDIDRHDFMGRIKDDLGYAESAVSRDWAFTAVLIDCIHDRGLIGTDRVRNLDGEDVHMGPFCTRNFFAWLTKNNLATVVKGPIVHGVRAFMAKLDKKACARWEKKILHEYTEWVRNLPENLVQKSFGDWRARSW